MIYTWTTPLWGISMLFCRLFYMLIYMWFCSCNFFRLTSTVLPRHSSRCASLGHQRICRCSGIFFRPSSCKDHHH
ncbi:hypothetical protein HanXRQr2_Chr12g0530551 [Helianthus annuus]|uniref:Uncharacterized protein n=1 Tax=Helianthus annuus TaxID=4232 RepID=A0A9K3EQL5_HELAN|nr:hypothetical protein HanXRQr2_Chr12g0530551 [Helianthus annuus]KAJ0861845.1 hypothetical protein HanPSC8_Chr12g0511241 [Helianthus annuus]